MPYTNYEANPLITVPGGGAVAPDKAVLFWESATHSIRGSADFVFNDTLKALALTGKLTITSNAIGTIPLTVKAFSGQTANLQEWQNSSGTALASIEKGGAIKSLGLINATVAKTAAYTATVNDHLIKCDATGAAFTITLPAAASFAGQLLHIKKTDASANRITIDGNASELVEDALTQQLIYQGENFMLQCDGSQWWVI